LLSRSEKENLYSQHVFDLQRWTASALPTLDSAREVAQLLNALPDLEIKSEAAFVPSCKKWLRVRQCEKFFKAEKNEIAMFLADNLFIEDWQAESNAALQHLVEHFHLFGGKTRGAFVLWVAKRLRNWPAMKNGATLRDYIAMGIDDFDDATRDLSDLKFTEHEMPFGKEYHIPLADGHVWRVRDLKHAKGLWPVHIKEVNGTAYVVKVVRRQEIFVHRLLFRIGIGEVVKAFDGDFTNFSLYPYSCHTEVFWGDWPKPRKYSEEKPDNRKTKKELKLVRAPGTKAIYTKLEQKWVSNLYVAHDTQANLSAQDRQDVFEQKKMLQPLEIEGEDGEKERVDFGGMSSGYLNPVATADVVRPVVANKNSPAWEKLDRADERESEGVQRDMSVAAIRDRNREMDHAQDGDVAGLKVRQPEPDRPTLVEDVEAVEEEMVKAEN
jgi:hypothetical protein